MLRVAVPNKGALSESAAAVLAEAGYRKRSDSKDLTVLDINNDVEFFFLRPKDVAIYVGAGTLDLGITGRDLARDSGAQVDEELAMGFGSSTFRYAAPAGQKWSVDDLGGKRIATSYPNLVRDDLASRGMTAEIIRLDGAVEISIQLGVADAIADVVSTGTTLRQAGLEIFGPVILESTAVLISTPDKVEHTQTLIKRLEGVLVARRYSVMDYDIPAESLQEAMTITPGFQSPTVSPLHDETWFAVRSLVPNSDLNQVMDKLSNVGARAILVTALQAARM
ncbi:ATP phosphoribosyltransferase [Gordonia sp. UBA7860]|uniref:ATP phosphoribosyltransferase n=1 Tax=Gordonia sp. UBA7860 TaxID=1946579 RepID=UPI00257C1F34|nr:ATP phosphoribosyltransferase [Gordonia sp. UBA7860]